MVFDLTTAILVGLVFVGLYFIKHRKGCNLPPGPWGLPIVGSIPFLEGHIGRAIRKLSKRYNSDVISVQIGSKPVIFLNSYDVIKEAFTNSDLTDRPDHLFILKVCSPGKPGITESDGPIWKEQRRFAISIIKEHGAHNTASEDRMLENIRHLVAEIEKTAGEKFDPTFILQTATGNVISSAMYGRSYPYGHNTDLRRYLQLGEETRKLMPPDNLINIFPPLRHLPGNVFNYKRVLENMSKLFRFIADHIEEHRARFDPHDLSDLVDKVLAEKIRQDGKNPEIYSDNRLEGVLNDMFSAGYVTTSATLMWGFLFLITYPEIQERVQKELDDVIGRDRTASVTDRHRLPYTEATINEIHRFATVVPMGMPRSNNTNDVTFRDYVIPKTTPVFANIWAVHRDPQIWKSPDKFDPSNFLDDEGRFVNKKELIPFSIGRRQCPGENLAKLEIFLTFASLLQKFTFSSPEGATLPGLEPQYRVIHAAPVYEICARPRH